MGAADSTDDELHAGAAAVGSALVHVEEVDANRLPRRQRVDNRTQ
jgi:hypothetical protein